jgi:ribosomal protein S17
MSTASISALAALLGSVIGALTSLIATWLSQSAQARTQQLMEHRTRRQQLYQAFIEEASRLYAHALTSNDAKVGDLVGLYAMVARMRVLSAPEVVRHAEAVAGAIIDMVFEPVKDLRDLRDIVDSNRIDPFRDFADACRDDLTRSRWD